MSEERKLEFATLEQRKDGWILSPRFILKIERKIREHCGDEDCPSWEGIELVLLAYHGLLGKEANHD